MNRPLAYLNGRLVPFADAALPLHDAGFVSGATVVDNARTFRHRLFRWPDHLARFRRDCDTCYVPLAATDEQLTATAEELVAHNARLLPPGGELQLVTFATPGPLGLYLGDAADGPPTLGMVTYPLPFARYRRFFADGVTLAFAGSHPTSYLDILPPRVKHRSRMHWHVAGRVVNDPAHRYYRPGAVPVVVSGPGASDTAIGGLLAVLDGAVVRQVPETVQESISLNVVGELCAELGLRFIDQPLDMWFFGRAKGPRPIPSEMMLAGTGFCLAGVRTSAYADASRDWDWPGPVFRRLLAAWSDLVGLDIERQFLDAG